MLCKSKPWEHQLIETPNEKASQFRTDVLATTLGSRAGSFFFFGKDVQALLLARDPLHPHATLVSHPTN